MSEPRALVEHFSRHEFRRLVAKLTRSLGVRRLALVEDPQAPGTLATLTKPAPSLKTPEPRHLRPRGARGRLT